MRVFMITDTHFGIYLNNLDKWLNMMESTFYNFVIPYLKENAKPGDILIHCGDLYDNRTSIPIIASYKAEKILLELSEILPLHIIVGNHDLWNKGSNDINSVRLFNHVNNVNVYTNTTTIEVDGQKLVLMPWAEKRLDMIKEITNNQGDYLFCHSDLNGCRMHLNSVAHRNADKIDVDEFKKYKHVFSGHIHIRQTNENFSFIGSKGKEYAMRMVVMPRVGYTGQGANLTDAQIKKLDSVTLGYARKNLKLLAGFPTAPLVHHQLINHPLPSSIYYEARLASLWRNLGRAGRPSFIIQEQLDRAL